MGSWVGTHVGHVASSRDVREISLKHNMIAHASSHTHDSLSLSKLRIRYPVHDKGGSIILRTIGTALLTSMLFMFGFVTPAQATEPVTIPPGTFVVDESDVLDSGEQDQLEQQVNQLQSEHSATAFLIFVPLVLQSCL